MTDDTHKKTPIMKLADYLIENIGDGSFTEEHKGIQLKIHYTQHKGEGIQNDIRSKIQALIEAAGIENVIARGDNNFIITSPELINALTAHEAIVAQVPSESAAQPAKLDDEKTNTIKQEISEWMNQIITANKSETKVGMRLFTPSEDMKPAAHINNLIVDIKHDLKSKVHVVSGSLWIDNDSLASLNLPDLNIPKPQVQCGSTTTSNSKDHHRVIQDPETLVGALNKLYENGNVSIMPTALIIRGLNAEAAANLKSLGRRQKPIIDIGGNSQGLIVSKTAISKLPGLNHEILKPPQQGLG